MLNLKDPTLLKQQCYINGHWLAADSGATIDVTNPASGDILGTVPRMGADETHRAIRGGQLPPCPPGGQKRLKNAPSSCDDGSI